MFWAKRNSLPASFLRWRWADIGLRGLKVFPQFPMAIAHVVGRGAAELFSVRVRGDLHDTKINTEEIIYLRWFRIVDVARHGQVKLAAMVDQIRLALLQTDLRFLTITGRVGDSLTTFNRPDVRPLVLETENARVVADSSMLGESSLTLPVQLVRVGNLGEQSNHNLSTQFKTFPCLVVKQLVQGELGEDFTVPCFFAQPIGTGIGNPQSTQQGLPLFCARVQSDFGRNLQPWKNITERMRVRVALRTMRYPSPA
jgi:hypothetical protein